MTQANHLSIIGNDLQAGLLAAGLHFAERPTQGRTLWLCSSLNTRAPDYLQHFPPILFHDFSAYWLSGSAYTPGDLADVVCRAEFAGRQAAELPFLAPYIRPRASLVFVRESPELSAELSYLLAPAGIDDMPCRDRLNAATDVFLLPEYHLNIAECRTSLLSGDSCDSYVSTGYARRLVMSTPSAGVLVPVDGYRTSAYGMAGRFCRTVFCDGLMTSGLFSANRTACGLSRSEQMERRQQEQTCISFVRLGGATVRPAPDELLDRLLYVICHGRLQLLLYVSRDSGTGTTGWSACIPYGGRAPTDASDVVEGAWRAIISTRIRECVGGISSHHWSEQVASSVHICGISDSGRLRPLVVSAGDRHQMMAVWPGFLCDLPDVIRQIRDLLREDA